MLERKDYTKGRKFRVVKEPAAIRGMVPIAPYTQQGFCKSLKAGEVLTCDGISMTFGDGVPIVKWNDADNQWICNDAEFTPSVGGMWNLLPAPGYLEPVDA